MWALGGPQFFPVIKDKKINEKFGEISEASRQIDKKIKIKRIASDKKTIR